MSNGATPIATSDVQRASEAGVGKQCLLSAVLICTYLPLVLMHFRALWQHPHYRFFPVVLAIVGVFIWQRWPRSDSKYAQASGTVRWLMGSALVLLAVAVLLVSPDLGYVAAVLMTGAMLAHFAGREFWQQLFSPWVLLFLIVPPFSWDVRLINALQNLSSKVASAVLDWFGVLHALAGNVIDLPGHRLFVKEAGGGLQSLFLLILSAALCVVWMRRSWLHSLLLIGSSVIWAALFNVARIITVVAALSSWGLDFSVGWKHHLLGIVMFTMAVAMLISTDRFLWLACHWSANVWTGVRDWLKPRRHRMSRIERTESERTESERSSHSEESSNEEHSSSEEHSLRQNTATPPQRSSFSSPLWYVLVSTCGLLLVLQIVIFIALPRPGVQVGQVTSQLNQSAFPAEQNAWTQTDFTTEQRDAYSEFGRHSKVWSYKTPFCQAEISFDYPFVGWHELTHAYRNLGWNMISRSVHQGSATEDTSTHPLVEVELSKPTGERGYLLFVAFDEAGRDVQPPPNTTPFWSSLHAKIVGTPVFDLLRETEVANADTIANTYRMRAFVETDFRLSPEQCDDVRTQFVSFSQLLRSQWEQQP